LVPFVNTAPPAKKEESIDGLEKLLKNDISFPKDIKDSKSKV
jgi:hypothetical protein